MSYLFPLLWEYAEWEQKSLFTERRIIKTEEKIKKQSQEKQNQKKKERKWPFFFLNDLLKKTREK